MRFRSSFTMTLLGAVLLGALLTIAIAWGCRFAAQFDHETYGATDPFNGAPLPRWSASDAQWRWILARPDGISHDPGADGRLFIRAESHAPEWTSDGLQWNDFGVDVVAVSTRRSAWRTIPSSERMLTPPPEFVPSPDPGDWAPPDGMTLPPWSTLAEASLTDHSAVIEVASGWPWRAFVARHHLPNRPNATHPLIRETTGAWYGTPYGDDTLHQLPYGVIGRGVALNTIVWMALVPGPLVLVMIAAGRIRAFARHRRAHCVHCAYVIGRTATDATCPECGGAARRWRPTFGRPARAIWGVNLLVAAVLAVHAGAILAAPEVTPFERAAFDGDVPTMRTLASAEGFVIPRGPHGGAQPTLIGGRAGRAAMLADQHDAMRYLMELEGVTPKSPGESYDLETLRPLIQLIDTTTMWPEVVTTFDLLGEGRLNDDHQFAALVAVSLCRTQPGRDLLLTRLRDDVGVRQRFWPETMFGLLANDAEADARRALPFVPPAPIVTTRLDTLGRHAIRYAFAERPSRSDARSEARRRPLVADLAHALGRAGDAHADPSRWTIVTADTLSAAIELESPDAFDAAIQFLATLPPPPRGQYLDELMLFEMYYADAVVARLPERWRALAPFNLTPNVCHCSADTDAVPLRQWVARQDSADHVRALLELGAIITDRILLNATRDNAEILHAWIEDTGATVYTHREVYPAGADTYAQIPGADDASIRRPPS